MELIKKSQSKLLFQFTWQTHQNSTLSFRSYKIQLNLGGTHQNSTQLFFQSMQDPPNQFNVRGVNIMQLNPLFQSIQDSPNSIQSTCQDLDEKILDLENNFIFAPFLPLLFLCTTNVNLRANEHKHACSKCKNLLLMS